MNHSEGFIHWHEGVFLRPHIFQLQNRKEILSEFEKVSQNPYWWGISEIKIDKELLKKPLYSFRIKEAKIRLLDGTWLNIHENAYAQEKSFSDDVKTIENEGFLSVWIGIKKINSNEPVAHDFGKESIGKPRPFIIREITIPDENTGKNQQKVKVRLWNVHTFFKKPDSNFSAIKIGELTRSSNMNDQFDFNQSFIPPLLKLGASTYLKNKLYNIAVQLINQSQTLQRDYIEKQKKLSSDPVEVLSELQRMQIASSFGLVLHQMHSMDELHPWQVYLELVRLAGSLIAISPDTRLDIPPYDHDKIFHVMDRVFNNINTMLKTSSIPDYITKPFEFEGDRRLCHIEKEWLDNDCPFYLCIEDDENDVFTIINSYDVKIGTPLRNKHLINNRLNGFQCTPVKAPGGLSDRSMFHYFLIEISQNQNLFNYLKDELIIEITGLPENIIPEMTIRVKVKQGEYK